MGILLRLMAWLLFKAFRLAVAMLLLGGLVSYVGYRVTRSGGGQPARSAAAPAEGAPESAVRPAESAAAAVRRARPSSPEERELLEEQSLLFPRQRWDGHLESLAVRGATDEEIALARGAAERNMAQLAERGRLAVERARHGPGWTPPPPDPVEQKRESIAHRRRKREASWDRWIARKEASGMSGEQLAQERAWVERRKAEDRAREDLEVAELEERMRRRGGGGVPAAADAGYNP